MKKFLILPIIVFTLASCSRKDVLDIKPSLSDAEMYKEIVKNMHNNSSRSEELVNDMRLYYPTSKYIEHALILQVYFNYINYKFNESEVAAKVFLKRYPKHSAACYVRYMLSMSYYMQISDPERDQEVTERTIRLFDDTEKFCPNTRYAEDVALRREYAYQVLMAKKMEVAKFYQKNNDIVAAIHRYRDLYNNMRAKFLEPEILYRIIVCYKIIGADDIANMYFSKLLAGHKGSEWAKLASGVMS